MSAAYAERLLAQRRRDTPPPLLHQVTITGNRLVDERTIRSRIDSQPGTPVDVRQASREAARIYGFGDFASVIHRIVPTPDGSVLDFVVHEKPWGPAYLHFGLRLETDFDNHAYWSALINYSRRRINARGGELRVDLITGRERGLAADFYQPLDFGEHFFIDPAISTGSRKVDLYEGEERIAIYDADQNRIALDTGYSFREYGEFRIGLEYGDIRTSVDSGASQQLTADDTLGAVHSRLALDRLDNAFFARRGYLLSIKGRVADSALYQRLSEADRLIAPTNWNSCTLFDVNFHPQGMTAHELRTGFHALAIKLYSDAFSKWRRDTFKRNLRQ